MKSRAKQTYRDDKRAAVALAKDILSRDRLTPLEFAVATHAIQVYGWKWKNRSYLWPVKVWWPLLKAAYKRMSPADQKEARPTMLGVCRSAGRFKDAAKFITRNPKNALEFCDTVEVLWKLGRKQELLRLEQIWARRLSTQPEGIESARNAAGLVRAAWARDDHARCRAISPRVQFLDIFWVEALLVPVLSHLADAKTELRAVMGRIREYERLPKNDLDRALPDFRRRQLGKAKTELARISVLLSRCLRSKYSLG